MLGSFFFTKGIVNYSLVSAFLATNCPQTVGHKTLAGTRYFGLHFRYAGVSPDFHQILAP